MRYVKFILLVLAAFSGVVPLVVLGKGQAPTPVIQIDIPTPFPQAKEAFDDAIRILKNESYNANLNEEIVYYSALKGVLRQLSPANNKELLKLWGPEVDKMVQANISGVIGSIGIRFLLDSHAGIAFVSDVMPQTPAEKQGLKLRDAIETIDGKSLKGLSPNDVAAMIERPVGTKVKLALRRGTQRFEKVLACETIKVDDVRSETIKGLGLIRIRYFSKEVAQDVENELKKFREKKVPGVIIDLRDNSGGLLDAGANVADLFLSQGDAIFYFVGRDGEPKKYVALSDHGFKMPLAVIINGETASAAELVTASLKDNKRANVVGVPSKGKGTIERITKLKNGYSMTFTTDALYGPSGEPWQGKGIVPDKPVPLDPASLENARLEEDVGKRINLDKQLAAAVELLAGAKQ